MQQEDGDVRKWFALRVRTKCEELVRRCLEEKGYNSFLPTYREDSDNERPYFPGYLFSQFNPFARLPVLTTPHVLQIVSFGRGPTEVPADQVDALRTLVTSGVEPIECAYLRQGALVRVIGGPLQGLQGIVLKRPGGARLVISVDILMRSVAVEIDPRFVRAVADGGADLFENRIRRTA